MERKSAAVVGSLAVVTFGRFSIVRDGTDVTSLVAPVLRRVFAHLLLSDGPCDRHMLAAELWPEAPEAAAAANLRRRVHELGRALERLDVAQPLVRHATTIGLAPAIRDASDLVRYRRALADGDDIGAAHLYVEPVFPGIDDDWLTRERERLHVRHVEIATTILESALRAANVSGIYDAARTLLDLDPLSEELQRRAIAALQALGEDDRARRLFDRFAQTMRKEIGVEPEALVTNYPRRRRPTARKVDGERLRRIEAVLAPIAARGAELRGAHAQRSFGDLERQMDAIRSALESAIVREGNVDLGVRALAALSRFFFERAYTLEGRRWYDEALIRLAQPSALRAEALYLRALLGRASGTPSFDQHEFEIAIEELREFGDEMTLAKALLYAANAARMYGNGEEARTFALEAQRIVSAHGDAYLVALGHAALGAAAYTLGDLDTAQHEFMSAIRIYHRLGASSDEALAISNVGRCFFGRGDARRAEPMFRKALALALQCGNRYAEAHARLSCALAAIDRRDIAAARPDIARASEIALGASDAELSLITLEAAAELWVREGAYERAASAMTSADGVRKATTIGRPPTDRIRCDETRDAAAAHAVPTQSAVRAPETTMRALLGVMSLYDEGMSSVKLT